MPFFPLLAGMILATAAHAQDAPPDNRVLVIAHRGASALRPEHTLAAYAKAIEDGADFIEPDLVPTRDGVLVARHENEIGGTTDVAQHPEFAARRSTRRIDGIVVTGWFTEDFTLAELKTLRARERLPQLRGTAFDGRFPIATLDEIIGFVAAEASARGRSIGLIPEIKHSSYFQQRGLPMEARLLATLDAHAYTRAAPVVIQSFEIANLKALRQSLGEDRRNIQLLQLIGDPDEQPGDALARGETLRYADMLRPDGLRQIARYAQILGPNLRSIIPLTAEGGLGTPTSLVNDAHRVGLKVQPYTFRPENHFLPADLRSGQSPEQVNVQGALAEIHAFLAIGIDGFFTDAPAIGRQAVDAP